MQQSNAQDVYQFTTEAGAQCPNEPTAMTEDSVKFIIRMIISELDELACTVTHSAEERDALLAEAMRDRDKCSNYIDSYQSDDEKIGAQFDALVDAWYYSLNVSARHGVNLSSIFNLVHQANMAKKDPITGKFLKRESDGKIIKPVGWKSPDITAEVARQRREGTWY